MPAVSKAQFKKMFVLYKEKKITKKQLDDFTSKVNYKKLPARKRKSVRKVRRGKR
jgi:hypothetical protein